MPSNRLLRLVPVMVILVLVSLFFGGVTMMSAQGEGVTPTPPPPAGPPYYHGKVTPAERKAAGEAAAAARAAAASTGKVGAQAIIGPHDQPDYWGSTPNYANSPLPQVISGGIKTYLPIIAGNPLSTTTPISHSPTSLVVVVPGTGIRKFVDALPGLGPSGANNLGQYIPVAVADTTTYSGCDYYEIALVDYTEQMHSDLPATRLRGYVQLETSVVTGSHYALHYLKTDGTPGGDPIMDAGSHQVFAVDAPHYLGPIIIAQKDRPVRVKFTNYLRTGTDGNLFIPVDTTDMGAGTGPDGTMYTQNRATLHLHGGATPWISDGTPHQWTTPAGDTTHYPKGVSVQNVPDMPDPGPGSLTFFYTNQQSARLMFYHDHAYGITRLNVYAGEAAGYLLQDPMEQTLVVSNIIPADQIPLVIQDKTFVPTATQLAAEDPTWDTGKYGGMGNLWFPHVYMTNQNPYTNSGVNAMGRWDYGPWFWPPYTGLAYGPVTNAYSQTLNEPPMVPGTPLPSLVPEGFMDTPVINGTAYPYLVVQPKAYRFRILNASNDRMWNLQMYMAKSSGQMWDAATGLLRDPNAGEVPMVPAVPNSGLPSTWPTDGRDGGVPDPAAAGPTFIQIGTEGGFLPAPVVLDNTPIGYNYNRRDIVVLNISNKTLFMGPAERADVIVDFSQYAGKTIIMYNDAPAPVPAFDPRYDYYTGDPDQTAIGGAPSTQPGYGPNTRTIMQIQVTTDTQAAPFDLTRLQDAFATTNAHTGVFAASLDPIIVPQDVYNSAYNASFSNNNYVRIQDTSMTFTPMSSTVPVVMGTPLTMGLGPKAIQELFEVNYGRMNATLGVELPNTNVSIQTTIPFGYIDPPTEVLTDSITTMTPAAGDGTQIWKITHNGVDTHAIHFHLFNVQLINRVGWDGAIRPPDPNELGWKETVRMNPLEDAIVAMRPVAPQLPFGITDSVRSLDVTSPATSTMGFLGINPLDGTPISVINSPINFGWEYVWHCHLLGHEENDMMRPMVFEVTYTVPITPTGLTATQNGTQVDLQWTDGTPTGSNLGNPANEIGFRIERSLTGAPGSYTPIGAALANQTTYSDKTVASGTLYYYQVVAFNVTGAATSDPVSITTP